MTIKDLKDFPKELLKEDEITLYKAFYVKKSDPDEELKVNADYDIFALSEEAATAYLLFSVDWNEFASDDIHLLIGKDEYPSAWNLDELKSKKAGYDVDVNGLVIPILHINVNTKTLIDNDIINKGELYWANDMLSLTLHWKEFAMKELVQKRVVSFNLNIDKDKKRLIKDIKIKNIKLEEE